MRNNTRQTRRNYGAPLASVWRGIRKAGHGAPACAYLPAAAIGAVSGFEREAGPHSIVKIMAIRDRRRREGDHHDRSGCDGASPSLWLEGEGADCCSEPPPCRDEVMPSMLEFQPIDQAFIPELPNYYRGKVRENYDLPDGRRIIIATDRLSAFDRAIASIPFKGQVLTQTARFWFEKHRRHLPEPCARISRSQRRRGPKARYPAGRDRGSRLSRRHHRHLGPHHVQAGQARDVRHSLS